MSGPAGPIAWLRAYGAPWSRGGLLVLPGCNNGSGSYEQRRVRRQYDVRRGTTPSSSAAPVASSLRSPYAAITGANTNRLW
jgi:hypothetical protein